MKKALVAGAVLLGMVVGAVGYHLALRCGLGRPSEKVDGHSVAAIQTDLAEIRRHLVGIETRLVRVEAKPGFAEVLDDPAMRERLAAVMVETRNPGMVTPRPIMPGTEAWRESVATRFRSDYARILEDAKKAVKLDEAAWKGVQPVFEKHFGPVEAVLKDVASGRASAPPKINELVAPGLANTLATLQKALPADAWQVFDAWRKAEEKSPSWGAGKGDYFLDGEDYKSYQVKRAAVMHWAVLQSTLPGLYEKLPLEAPKKDKFEAALKGHVSKVFDAFKDAPRVDLQSDPGRTKVKAFTAATEAELGAILGRDGLQKFREWKTSPGNRAAIYFGEVPKEPLPGPVGPPAAPPSPVPLPVPKGDPQKF